jgi:hypothetical protein
MTDIDLGFVGDELGFVGCECADDSFEGCSYIGEVGDTTTDDEDLAIRTGRWAREQVD